MGKKNNSKKIDPISNEIKGWTMPRLVEGKETFVCFYCFDPMSGRNKRKKYMLGRCKTRREVQRRSKMMIHNLARKLESGWNPWIENSSSLTFSLFSQVAETYHDYLYKRLNDHSLREDTVCSYVSYLNISGNGWKNAVMLLICTNWTALSSVSFSTMCTSSVTTRLSRVTTISVGCAPSRPI